MYIPYPTLRHHTRDFSKLSDPPIVEAIQYHTIPYHTKPYQETEMQKAASMASVLVLIFLTAVLIFGLPRRKSYLI